MADSSVTYLDATGVTVAVDAQLPPGGERQQTVTIGDGVNPGRVANVQPDGALEVASNIATGSALSNTASSATSVTLITANQNRRGLILFNDSTAALYLTYGPTAASTTSFTVKVAAGGMHFMDVPVFTGALQGLWAAANGFARVTDLSA